MDELQFSYFFRQIFLRGSHHQKSFPSICGMNSDFLRVSQTPISKGGIFLPKSTSTRNKRTFSPASTPRSKRSRQTPLMSPPISAVHENHLIASLTEYRQSQQIGLAIMDVFGSEIILYQFEDTPTYSNIMMILYSYDPAEIIISDTNNNKVLSRLISNELQLTQLTQVKRRYFNEANGFNLLKRLATTESQVYLQLDQGDNSKYLCLSAFAALTSFIQFSQSINFAQNSLKVSFLGLESRMRLDTATVRSLELVVSLNRDLPPKSSDKNKIIGSLFDLFKRHTKTKGGLKLLRSSILQPLCDINSILVRQDLIEEILGNEQLFFDLQSAMIHFSDLSSFNSWLVRIPRQFSESNALHTVSNLISLKAVTNMIPKLHDLLLGSSNILLQTIRENLDPQKADVLKANIHNFIEPNASSTNKTQIIFALKPDIDPALDLARSKYCQILEDIQVEFERVKSIHIESLEGASLNLTASRGFHFSIPASFEDTESFFLQKVSKGKRILCTTDDLLSLNSRRTEAYQDCLQITERLLQNLLNSIRVHMHWLITVSESISILDMMLAFVEHITLSDEYVKPEFTLDGPIAIKQCRHPLLEKILPSEFIANDIFLSPSSNLKILTGPNNSGKSTLISQIGLVTIMAHIGCFIPAEYASFRIVSQLVCCSSHHVEAEANNSSFYREMVQASYIIKSSSKNGFYLFDELCRGTSILYGNAISFSVCEHLQAIAAYTIFATHFTELTSLAIIYPNIEHISFKVCKINNQIQFLYSLGLANQEEIGQYGIIVSKTSGFPLELIEKAQEVSIFLKNSRCEIIIHRDRRKYELFQKIVALKKASLPFNQLSQYLCKLREAYYKK